MDRRLLRYYDLELQHLRNMGVEFAREFPRIAGRLGMEGMNCADPFVERLMEGVAFLTARVHLKLDAEFPRFTQAMLETVYPHYLAPTPSMVMLQFQPSVTEPGLSAGYAIARATQVRSMIAKGDQTACVYTTAHDVTLWPLKVAEAQYYTRELASLEIPREILAETGAKAGIRIRLETTAGVKFNQLALERLPIYIGGLGDIQARVYEQVIGHTVGLVMQSTDRPVKWQRVMGTGQSAHGPNRAVTPVGYEDAESLMPLGPRSFQGYRLLQEYFAFPQRYCLFEIGGREGLQRVIRTADQSVIDVIILLNHADLRLENNVDATNFQLFCSPAINLFHAHADRIHLSEKQSEFQIIPDRTKPLDFEVYNVQKVVGIGAGNEQVMEFMPFYRARDAEEGGAYYAVNRVPRVASAKEQRFGTRTRYPGSDVYLSLVDARNAPFSTDLKQLAVSVWCTNRDLPLTVPIGKGETDFTMEAGAPVTAIRSVSGQPTPPRPSYAEGDTAWRIISHLSLNYLSLVDAQGAGQGREQGATALRDLLRLYAGPQDSRAPGGTVTTAGSELAEFLAVRKQIEGVKSVSTRQVIRRVEKPGPISFARGLELTVTMDELNFEGAGVFLLGAVLARFFEKYVTINSFTETVISTQERGEVMRWPARLGQRHTL